MTRRSHTRRLRSDRRRWAWFRMTRQWLGRPGPACSPSLTRTSRREAHADTETERRVDGRVAAVVCCGHATHLTTRKRAHNGKRPHALPSLMRCRVPALLQAHGQELVGRPLVHVTAIRQGPRVFSAAETLADGAPPLTPMRCRASPECGSCPMTCSAPHVRLTTNRDGRIPLSNNAADARSYAARATSMST